MFLKYFTLCIIVFVLLDKCFCAVKVNFARCNFAGFTCLTLKTKNVEVTYQCPSGTDDVIIYINQFNAPTNIENVIIKNCRKLTLSVRCTSEKKYIHDLRISNIGTVEFQRLQYQSHLPTRVYLENIGYIETLPSYTFSQIDKPIHTIGCIMPKEDFGYLSLNNVSIDTVQSNAFNMPNNFANISFTDVRIKRLQTSALKVQVQKGGEFYMEKCSIGVSEHLAMQINAKTATFSENEFVDISSGGINGTVETFRFNNNSVNALHPHALSILSKNVFILNNRFEYLKSGALEKISPGLMEDSGRNFGTLRFVYEFNGNHINFMDAGCLQPDVAAYDNVANEMEFKRNRVFCSCENLGWLVSKIGHGYNSAPNEGIYETVLDKGNENNCSSSCDLPVSVVKSMVKNDQCDPNITTEWLCAERYTTTSTTVRSMLLNSTENNIPPKQSKSLSRKNTAQQVLASQLLLGVLVLLFGLV